MFNGYVIRWGGLSAGATPCIARCLAQTKGYVFAATQDNQCCKYKSCVVMIFLLHSTADCIIQGATLHSRQTALRATAHKQLHGVSSTRPTLGVWQEAYGVTSGTGDVASTYLYRLSVYECLVSGFRKNAWVYKLKRLFFFYAGSVRRPRRKYEVRKTLGMKDGGGQWSQGRGLRSRQLLYRSQELGGCYKKHIESMQMCQPPSPVTRLLAIIFTPYFLTCDSLRLLERVKSMSFVSATS
jgi:hypothetical protein